MRLIDADALKEELKEIYHTEPVFIYTTVHEAIDNAPTVEQSRWIPCSERLPNKGLRVLMQLDNIWQIVGWYDKEEADWYELTSEKPLDPNFRVLAWKPLPDAYERDKK